MPRSEGAICVKHLYRMRISWSGNVSTLCWSTENGLSEWSICKYTLIFVPYFISVRIEAFFGNKSKFIDLLDIVFIILIINQQQQFLYNNILVLFCIFRLYRTIRYDFRVEFYCIQLHTLLENSSFHQNDIAFMNV